jgi:ArsR family transcriptional regulator
MRGNRINSELAACLGPAYRKFTMKDQARCFPKEDRSINRRPIVGAEADAELALLSKALGHPARLQILRILTHRETCVCGDLVGAIELAQSTISQHLKVLKEAGLIQGTVSGPATCYCVNQRGLRRLKALVCGL